MNWKEQAKNLKTDIPALYMALKDEETPLIAKLFAGITVAYALSPIDLIPDFVPVLGYLDDMILLPLLVALTLKFIPQQVIKKNRKLSKEIWNNGKPKKWYFAIPIISIWLAAIVFLIAIVSS